MHAPNLPIEISENIKRYYNLEMSDQLMCRSFWLCNYLLFFMTPTIIQGR